MAFLHAAVNAQKKKRGEPPFVEIDGDLLAEATPKRVREKLVEALDKA